MHGSNALLANNQSDLQLQANVGPTDWVNPTPSGRYNLVVLGAGTAGLVAAAGAAGLGAKVALVERSLMGGDCLNFGCVPSKGLISAARVAGICRRAGEFGVHVPNDLHVDFGTAMDRMRRLRAAISHHDSAARFSKLGVDVYFGQGKFLDSNTIDVDGTQLKFKRAVIATGARASAPPISGLDQVDYLTNETIFALTALPSQLAVVGAGPIGCELAQAFAQLGAKVVLIESEHGVLPREDRDAAAIVQRALMRDGVQLLCCGHNLVVSKKPATCITVESHGEQISLPVDQLLISVGRTPNVDGLNLDAVGVDFNPKGVWVDDFLRTTNRNIYAAGDVCSRFQFTHAADFMARIVIQNALFKGHRKASSLIIPWCTYTSPEIAHVGLYEHQATEQGIATKTFIQSLAEVDRAILEGDEDGFVKVHVKQGTDRIVGATIVARNAGDLISELTVAITHGIGLSKIARTIHPYPTQADAIRKLGDQYNRSRLTPFVKQMFDRWLRWTR